MTKMLIIAEKPSVARDIAQALGGFSKVEGGWLERADAIVSSGIGHLVSLQVPEAQTTGWDLESLPVIPQSFTPEVIDRTKSQFNLLSKLMRRADVGQIINACDAGREGELIFRLIYEAAGCKKPMRRMWLQSMTSEAIKQAFNGMRPGAEFDNLADAARCRSEADWLIGINGSRGITRLKERQNNAYEMMTAGRVQTPTLAIVVHREQEIRSFVPKDYWEVHATFAAQAGTYVGRWVASPEAQAAEGEDEQSAGARIFDLAAAQALVAKCQGVAPSSVTDKARTTSSAPPLLFDLTTLQREANKRFKFSAKRTLDIAQALYEKHKATTYPRTDASALPEDYIDTAKQVVGTFGTDPAYGEHAKRVLGEGWVKPNRRIFDNAKISDHFAIIPTGTKPSGLDADESKIYDMVVRRFLAAFHPAAQYNVTTRLSVVASETFKSSGRVLTEPGWLVVYGQDGADGNKVPALCAVQPGEAVQTQSVDLKALQTKPPARFTEATLLAAMEGAGKLIDDDELRSAMSERGLGTPATRAATIEGLLADRDAKGRGKEPYLRREGKEQHLVPTGKGFGLISFLDQNGVQWLTSPKMTGDWEQKLRLMEKGQYEREAFMREIAVMTTEIIDVIRKKAASVPVAQAVELGVPCPKCGSAVHAQTRTFDCSSRCGFRLLRDIAQRDLKNEEAEQLLRDGEIKSLDGFVSKAKKKFSAGLKLNDEHKVEFVFEERVEQPLGAPIGAPCPNCGSNVHARGGDHPQFVCESGDFKLWRVIAGRALSDDEARELLTNGSVGPIHGFVSRARKKFSAGLRLSADNSKVEFVFEPR